MDTVDQFFDFVERGEHALVNLNPHFVLVPIYTSIMALFVHAVYSGDNFHTHVLLPYRHLVVSTSPAPRAPARKSSSASGTIATAAGFMRTRFVDLERTAFIFKPLNSAIALAASSPGPSSTNPKPRDRPVSLSVIMRAEIGLWPFSANNCSRLSSVVLY